MVVEGWCVDCLAVFFFSSSSFSGHSWLWMGFVTGL